MTEADRKAALIRVKKLAREARYLSTHGRALDLARLTTIVAELADEIAKILKSPQRRQPHKKKRHA